MRSCVHSLILYYPQQVSLIILLPPIILRSNIMTLGLSSIPTGPTHRLSCARLNPSTHTFRDNMASKPIVVVTGASGYAAGHVCRRLIESQKYIVRGAVRSKSKAKTGYLESIGVELYDGCDLMKPGSFDRVLEGARYVHHM